MTDKRRKILKTFGVIAVISVMMSLLIPFAFGFYDETDQDYKREVIIGFVFTVTLYISNHSVIAYWKDKYPLFEQTGRRLVLSLISMILLSSVIILIIHLILNGFNLSNLFNEGLTRSYRIAYLITFLVSLIYESISFFKGWEESIRSNENLKQEVLKYELSQLKSQLSPHFFFNSLNSLVELIETNQVKAVEFVNQLSSVYRYVLDMKNQDLVHISKEISLLKDYYSLLKIRFEDTIKLDITVDEHWTDKYIAPLTLQLLIENAIKHNFATDDQVLNITIFEEDEYWVIRNSISPKLIHEKSGIGLDNLKKRYSKFSNLEVIIEKTNEFFTIKIPILNVQ